MAFIERMRLPFAKPSADKTFTLTTSEVYLRHLSERVRLAGVPDDPTVKIRPHRGQWPLIVAIEEVDDYPHSNKIVYAVTCEDKPDHSWYFAADTHLTVISDEPRRTA